METNKKAAPPAGASFFFHTLCPLFLMITTCNFSIMIIYFVVELRCNFGIFNHMTLPMLWREAWTKTPFFDREAWAILGGYCAWSGLSLYLPGRVYHGPPTSTGFRPVYRDSGFTYYLLSLSVLSAGLLLPSGVSYYAIYQKLVPLSGSLLILALGCVAGLYVKGLLWPSPGESGPTGNFIMDIYWGRELYPRLGRWFDIKQWTNCRFGLMSWMVLVLLAWRVRVELYGWSHSMATASILQVLYLGKFYWWESGYNTSLDIILDRAGYYICWGCLCFLPTFWTLTSLYMVEHDPQLSATAAYTLLALGLGCTLLNYWADWQRQLVRATSGICTIWGRFPKILVAPYIDGEGKKRESVLLASGFWGLSRHFNYLPEWLANLLWSLPAGLAVLPLLQPLFLLVLLIHRAQRDHHKCAAKYGKVWEQYCRLVPYKIIPGIY